MFHRSLTVKRMTRQFSTVDCERMFKAMNDNGIKFYTGVPDSLLKDFCGYVTENAAPGRHIIQANEGAAVATAAGHYLATGSPAVVYTQNSGFGNMVNPLLSLTDKDVYGIPMLLLIGWRGEPGVKDEPQHRIMGARQNEALEALGIPYKTLPTDTEGAIEAVTSALDFIQSTSQPMALLVRKGTFAKYKMKAAPVADLEMNREDVCEVVTRALPNSTFVGTTGFLSRELYEIREKHGEGHGADFLCVGNMGHSVSIALGIARETPSHVVCLDGDGACLMHTGPMAIAGTSGAKNLLHVVVNNGLHESVGGQPTVGMQIDFCKIADGCGYKSTKSVSTRAELEEYLASNVEGPAFLEVRVKAGSRSDLGRPKTTPAENKAAFMERLSKF